MLSTHTWQCGLQVFAYPYLSTLLKFFSLHQHSDCIFVYEWGRSSAKTVTLITLPLWWRLNFLWCTLYIFKYYLEEEIKNVFSLYSLDTVPGGHTEEQEIQSGHIHMVCSQTERIRTGTVGRHHTSARSRQADTDTVPCRYHKCDSVNPLDHSYRADTPETKHHMRF